MRFDGKQYRIEARVFQNPSVVGRATSLYFAAQLDPEPSQEGGSTQITNQGRTIYTSWGKSIILDVKKMFNIFMSGDMRVRAPGEDRSTLELSLTENLVHDDLIRIMKEMITGVRDEDFPTFAKCFYCGSCMVAQRLEGFNTSSSNQIVVTNRSGAYV